VYDTVIIKPSLPVVIDSTYLIGLKSNPVNISVQVKGLANATFNYFINGVKQAIVSAIPSIKGVTRYTVSQTVNQIESDTVGYKITMLDPVDLLHIQKIASEAVLQPNSTYNMNFTFVVSNLMSRKLDSVVVSDNLTNAITQPAQYSVISVSSTGGLKPNVSFDGNSNQNLILNTSQLSALAVDTIHVYLNIIPKGVVGTLNNQAIARVVSPYGPINMNSSSATRSTETSKLPTPFVLPQVPLDIPEGFSPNRDGINDVFVITKPYGTTLELEVFNRWGNVVYYNQNYNNEWDGKGTGNFLGQDLVDGGYYYTIKAKDSSNNIKLFKGFVIIQR
jgi:gliding motility-associated-like protein